MARHKQTKAEVVAYCRLVFRENPELFRGDSVAQSQYFNDYTDALCKEGQITRRQYETWSNPF